MLSISAHRTMEEASEALFPFILDPANWVSLEQVMRGGASRPEESPIYQCRVGNLRICASVDVAPSLDVFLRVGFRAPGLTPMKAVDHLEAFLGPYLPLKPNTEWQVEVDGRKWIHFVRRWVGRPLEA